MRAALDPRNDWKPLEICRLIRHVAGDTMSPELRREVDKMERQELEARARSVTDADFRAATQWVSR